MADALGNITWWGFSPAIDFQDSDVGILQGKDYDEEDPLNILLVGAGDIRHVIKTIAQRHRHTKKKINMYVCESALELYARDILLMTVALEMQERMGLQEKSELFLELYGNLFVREQTQNYVKKMSTEFIKMVTDFDYMEEKLPLFDLSQLKFKERDFLEGIFKVWRNNDFMVDMAKCWDLRLRNYLKTRYDTRMNAFDWDYHMGLAERGADIINKTEYQSWRNNGVAFEFREGTYDNANKTLTSAKIFDHQGEKHGRMGYWGDTIVSPFISFGIESEDQSFFKKCNNMYTKTSSDISQYNMQAMLHEIATGQRFKMSPAEDSKAKSSVKLTEITEEEEEEVETEENETAVAPTAPAAPQDMPYKAIPVDNVKVIFLPLGSIKDHLMTKGKYQKLFSVVYFSNSMVHQLTPDINKIFADRCTVILETAQFMIEVKKDQAEEFVKKTTGMAKAAGCERMDISESVCFTRHLYKSAS